MLFFNKLFIKKIIDLTTEYWNISFRVEYDLYAQAQYKELFELVHIINNKKPSPDMSRDG